MTDEEWRQIPGYEGLYEVAAKLFTHQEIADAIGISFQQVSRIINRQRWAHVD